QHGGIRGLDGRRLERSAARGFRGTGLLLLGRQRAGIARLVRGRTEAQREQDRAGRQDQHGREANFGHGLAPFGAAAAGSSPSLASAAITSPSCRPSRISVWLPLLCPGWMARFSFLPPASSHTKDCSSSSKTAFLGTTRAAFFAYGTNLIAQAMP